MSPDHDDVVGDGIGHDDGIGGEGISACLKIQIDLFAKLSPATFGINWFATISSFDHPKVSKVFVLLICLHCSTMLGLISTIQLIYSTLNIFDYKYI